MRSSTRHLMAVALLAAATGAGCSDTTAPVSDTADQPFTPSAPDSVENKAVGVNPFAGSRLFIDTNSPAAKQARTWRASRLSDAQQMDKIAGQPHVDWIGGWFSDVRAAVSARAGEITNAGALPVFVAYNIPNRDCGSYSSGGVATAAAYKSWIREFAAGIGARKAVVILEPDALPALTCLSAGDARTRVDLIRDAVQVLKAQPNVAVYIDAGHSSWQSAATMIDRLTEAGIAQADGFSLNISNFETNANIEAYGAAVSRGVGGKHFIYDTSRNGHGPANTWCNPDGRGLGSAPTTDTSNPLVDARLWIKYPGESDGACNGGPSAGTWWANYALGLAQRAVL